MSKMLSILGGIPKYALLIFAAIVTIYPFYWMLWGGTMSEAALQTFVFQIRPGGYLVENLKALVDIIDFPVVLMNTIIVSVVGTLISVVINLLMGYALALYEFKSKQMVFSFFMASMFLGGITTMIASYQLIVALGLYNSLWAIILPGVFSVYSVFLFRQSLLDFPGEIIESGRLDGCNEFIIFLRLVVPNSMPIILTVSLFTFMGYWGGYLWNLIVVSDMSKYTLQVALSTIYPNAGVYTYAPVKMLGAFLSILPILILFLLMQKFFINSMTGSVKG